MLRHLGRELPAEHVLEPGVVVDPLGIEQLAPGHTPLQHDGVEHAPAGIHRGADPCRPRPNDDQIVYFASAHAAPPVPTGFGCPNIERAGVPACSPGAGQGAQVEQAGRPMASRHRPDHHVHAPPPPRPPPPGGRRPEPRPRRTSRPRRPGGGRRRAPGPPWAPTGPAGRSARSIASLISQVRGARVTGQMAGSMQWVGQSQSA